MPDSDDDDKPKPSIDEANLSHLRKKKRSLEHKQREVRSEQENYGVATTDRRLKSRLMSSLSGGAQSSAAGASVADDGSALGEAGSLLAVKKGLSGRRDSGSATSSAREPSSLVSWNSLGSAGTRAIGKTRMTSNESGTTAAAAMALPLRRDQNVAPIVAPGAVPIRGNATLLINDDRSEETVSERVDDLAAVVIGMRGTPIAAQVVDESVEFKQAEELAQLRAYREEQERLRQEALDAAKEIGERQDPVHAVVLRVDGEVATNTRKRVLVASLVCCLLALGVGVGVGFGSRSWGETAPLQIDNDNEDDDEDDDEDDVVDNIDRSPTASPAVESKGCFTERSHLLKAIGDYAMDQTVGSIVAQERGHPIGAWCFSGIQDFSGLFSDTEQAFNPDISRWNVTDVVDMGSMFELAQGFNQDLSTWDVSKVQNMSSMFKGASDFEGRGLENWSVGNVVDMAAMFEGTPFDGNITQWDVSKVTTTAAMFRKASTFNQDISGWNLTSVVTMDNMFESAGLFEQNLCTWNEFVENRDIPVGSMFNETRCSQAQDPTPNQFCSACAAPSSTPTASLIPSLYPSSAPTGSTKPTRSMSPSDVPGESPSISRSPSITSFPSILLNPPTSEPNVIVTVNPTEGSAPSPITMPSRQPTTSPVTIPSRQPTSRPTQRPTPRPTRRPTPMPVQRPTPRPTRPKTRAPILDGPLCFRSRTALSAAVRAYVLNPSPDSEVALSRGYPIGTWCFNGVTDFSGLFSGLVDFNEDVSGWDVSGVSNMASMFSNAASFNQDLNSWDVRRVTDMSAMFAQAGRFAGDLSNWEVSRVRDMSGMFRGASRFNSDIARWNVDAVENFGGMFREASMFNQDLSRWVVSNGRSFGSMFRLAVSFDQNLCRWKALISNDADVSQMFLSSGCDVVGVDQQQPGRPRTFCTECGQQ